MKCIFFGASHVLGKHDDFVNVLSNFTLQRLCLLALEADKDLTPVAKPWQKQARSLCSRAIDPGVLKAAERRRLYPYKKKQVK